MSQMEEHESRLGATNEQDNDAWLDAQTLRCSIKLANSHNIMVPAMPVHRRKLVYSFANGHANIVREGVSIAIIVSIG